jgi:hypothetical protein
VRGASRRGEAGGLDWLCRADVGHGAAVSRGRGGGVGVWVPRCRQPDHRSVRAR